ncbi:MAG: hypothetical protein WBA74_06450 [Cyclobacteriaceae bacterium]
MHTLIDNTTGDLSQLITSSDAKNSNSLSINSGNTSNVIMLKGSMTGDSYKRDFKKLLYDIQLKRNNFPQLHIYLNLSTIDNKGLINLFAMVQTLNDFAAGGGEVAFYWNTIDHPQMKQTAKEFKEVLNGYLYY